MKRLKENEINEIVEILKYDGVVSVATDTVFGVCARFDHKAAQERLREVKNRPLTKAFPIMCANKEQIQNICYIEESSEKLIDAFMPGPVTLILRKKEDIPSYVNGGMETLAIRMATSKTLEAIIDALGCPVFMTSANQSGQPVCENLDEIEKQCPLLDAMVEGEVSLGEASTIIDCTKEDITILRQGPIKLEDIHKILK